MERLLKIWPTVAAIAEALGLPYPTVAAWVHRGIPARRYVQIIAAARKSGHVLTFEDLAVQIEDATGGRVPARSLLGGSDSPEASTPDQKDAA